LIQDNEEVSMGIIHHTVSLVLLFAATLPSTASAELVEKKDTLWFTFNTSSFWYEENFAIVSLGSAIPATRGRDMAGGPALLTRDGNFGYADLLRKPRVEVVSDAATFSVKYSYPKAFCGSFRAWEPNCRITFQFTIPMAGAIKMTAPYDPAQEVLEVYGKFPALDGSQVLKATISCLKGKRCKRVKNYAPEPGGWTAQIKYVNN
jgi:hypothetical protein